MDDAFRTYFIHCERSAFPVARCAEFLELFEDNAAVLLFPLPCVLQELFTSQVAFSDAFLCEFVYHFGFCRDGGVVSAWHPQCVFAHEASPAHKDVLYSVVEHMPHVKDTGDVGWGYHYCERFASVRLGVKQTMFHPVGIPAVLNGTRIVF